MDEIMTEHTPLVQGKGKKGTNSDYDDYDESDVDFDIDGADYFDAFSGSGGDNARQSIAADRLSERLLAIDDDDDMMEDLILHETLDIEISERAVKKLHAPTTQDKIAAARLDNWTAVEGKLLSMTSLCVLAFGLIASSFWIGAEFIGPPNQPVGPYSLVERHVCIFLSFIVLLWFTYYFELWKLLNNLRVNTLFIIIIIFRREMVFLGIIHFMKDQTQLGLMDILIMLQKKEQGR